jgi:D-alanyl-D-alanine carboxypeptidase
MDDIPEAVREQGERQVVSRFPLGLIVVSLLGLGVIALLTGLFFLRPNSQSSVDNNPSTSVTNKPVSPGQKNSKDVVASPKPSAQPGKNVPKDNTDNTDSPQSSDKDKDSVDNLLGHLSYKEVAVSELAPITSDGRIKLHKTAAEKFKQMQADAAAAGIILNPLSGFRTIDEQDYLFFRVKEQRVQNAAKRAEVSAPPGYSEHHTGYAFDVGDGNVPATNLSPDFENTAAFRWLQENAARYSFELSFPRNNSQGVSYEPWHWRFVGDRDSLETFYKARNLKH